MAINVEPGKAETIYTATVSFTADDAVNLAATYNRLELRVPHDFRQIQNLVELVLMSTGRFKQVAHGLEIKSK